MENSKNLYIGNTLLPYGLLLAPLAGVSDYTFRKICRYHGAEYAVSEMISAKALCYEQKTKKKNVSDAVRTAPLAAIRHDDQPLAVQIFGNEPEFMAEAAHRIETLDYIGCDSKYAPCAIDINMGCPVHKVTSNGEGAALMKNPALCGKIVSAVAKSVKIPVTVKIRAGWDFNSVNAVEIAKICEDNGAAMICVHGRTRSQMYAPKADRHIIAEVKKAVSIPVIANGDIFTATDALCMYEETQCDGIMVARGALGNPWIFAEIKAGIINSDTAYIPPTAAEKISTAIYHAELLIKQYGKKNGLAQSRKHISWYIKGLHGAASVRNHIMCCEDFDEVKSILLSLLS